MVYDVYSISGILRLFKSYEWLFLHNDYDNYN